MADLAVWQRTIVDEEGNVVPGAEIEVRREEDDSLATLYADRAGETPLANPLAADMSGFVRFFAQGDAYTITAVGAGSTRTWRFDPTGRLQEFDRISEALVADDAADLVAARSNLGEFATVADVEGANIPPVLDSVRTAGGEEPGDRGGGLFVRAGTTEPEFGPKMQDASGVWFFKRTPPLNTRDFGIKGHDNEGSLVDESAAFGEALKAAAALKLPLQIPGTNYLVSGLTLTDGFSLYLEGDAINRPVIRGTQALADAGGTLLRLERTNYEVNTIAIVEDVLPNRKKVKLSSVSGLAVGMMIQWTSDQLWYYDPRDQAYKGEFHRIVRVLGSTNEIEVDDHTRDHYDISEETLTVRAWWPDAFELSSVNFWLPPPATDLSTRALILDRTHEPKISDAAISGSTFFGISNQRSWRARFHNVTFESIGRAGGVGYGLQDRSTYGTRVTGLKGRSLRRAIDFNSRNGPDSGAPSRDWLVEDFEITGGGTEFDGSEYWPEGSVASYGVGMHGPSENGVFRDGIISHVLEGVTVRGRNTEIRGVRFLGRIARCVSASFGTGLLVQGCTYERGDYPDKLSPTEAEAAETASTFVRLGVSSSAGHWGYDSPTVIQGNEAHGLRSSFILFASGNDAKNLVLRNNDCILRIPSGEEFRFLDTGAFPRLDVYQSVIDRSSNTFRNFGAGKAHFTSGGTNFRMGSIGAAGLDAAVQTGPLSYTFIIPIDGVARIKGVSLQGDPVCVTLTTNRAQLTGSFIVQSGSANLIALGVIGSDIVGTADPETLTGTTGAVGEFTVGLSADGDLWMENRVPALRRVNVMVRG